MTPDAWRAYHAAVHATFGREVDSAQLHKIVVPDPSGERRYSPPHCTGVTRHVVSGDPERDHISTSYVGRRNLTTRMGMRRFTRLTNAFSRKVEQFDRRHYNYCRPQTTLKGPTPAMAAGVTDHRWTLQEMNGLLDAAEAAKPRTRGPYKKRDPPPAGAVRVHRPTRFRFRCFG